MKKSKIFGIAISLVALTVVLSLASWIVKLKDSDEKYNDFKKEDQNFDVLFYGSSHVMNAIAPMMLWEKYGITSYNFGNSNSTLPQTYWTVKNSITINKPDIIVLDIAFIKRDELTEGVTWGHEAFDAFPLSYEKIMTVNDLYPTLEDKVDILFPFSRYHSRWSSKEIYAADNIFNLKYNIEKGAFAQFSENAPLDYKAIDINRVNNTETTGKKYLRKIIELCRDENIEIVLVNIPAFDNEETQEYNNSVQSIADDYGVVYLNMPYLNIVDETRDCADGNDHLNFYGACKVTGFIGDYLRSTYNIDDKRCNDAYLDWNSDYDKYIDYIEEVSPKCAEFADTFLKTE
ncbi:MAG: hypothetical protein K6A23_03865 [Butyrivibrio sp.]|nr:hypothetical protein [Butyrivibrio sp.]